MKEKGNKGLYIGIFFLSMATLSMEVSLSRILSVSLWYHFAFMIVSIAFLGLGASGTLLMIFPSLRNVNIRTFASISCLAFSISLIISYSFVIRIPIDPLKLVLEKGQLLNIFIIYLLLSIPFFFSGLTTAKIISSIPIMVHRIYFYDLIGGSVGCILIIFAFPLLGGQRVIPLCGLIGLISSFSFSWRWSIWRFSSIFTFIILFFVILISPSFLNPSISPYKDLSVSLRHPGAKHLGQYWNAISRIDIVDSPAVRFAPGLSLTYLDPLPKQFGITWDAERLSAITHNRSERDLTFTQYLPSSLPYHLTNLERIMIIEPMGGLDILIALHHGAKRITVVERNPLILKIIKDRFDDFTGGIYSGRSEKIEALTGSTRSIIAGSKELFDLIVIPITEIFGSSSTGFGGFGEDYIFTIEGFKTYLSRIKPQGFLSLSSFLLPPPRQEIRLLCNLMEGAENLGIPFPETHLLIYRSVNTFHILFKKTPLTYEDIVKFKGFCEKLLFDMIYYPGIKESETNRFNRFDRPIYYLSVIEVIDRKKRRVFLEDYLFDVKPVSDDRPFFNYFFKTSKIKEIYNSMGKKWEPLIEGGYLIPLILLQSTFASLFLILLPLIFFKKWKPHKIEIPKRLYFPPLIYFSLIGLAFMFIEITFVQKFILFLGEPVYSFSCVLFAILLFSSLGSRCSEFMVKFDGKLYLIKGAYIVLCVLLLLFLLIAPTIFNIFMKHGIFIRFAISFLMIGPISFLMGIPFPVGIRYLELHFPNIIPWAWCLNACASIIGPVLAISIAISMGFSFCLSLASILYLFSLLIIKREKLKEGY
jgi:hypothetical protein